MRLHWILTSIVVSSVVGQNLQYLELLLGNVVTLDRPTCEKVHRSATEKIDSLKVDFESTLFHRRILPQWRQFIVDAVSEPLCHLRVEEFQMKDLMPVYGLLIGEYGSLGCEQCQLMIDGVREVLTDRIGSKAENEEDRKILRSFIVDEILPVDACEYLLPKCGSKDEFVIKDVDEVVNTEDLLTIAGEKITWSSILGPNDAAGDPAYLIDPTVNVGNLLNCLGCTVCNVYFDQLAMTTFLDPDWIQHFEESELICPKLADLYPRLYNICNAEIDYLGQNATYLFAGDSICPVIGLCDYPNATEPNIYFEADLLRCLQNACQWVTAKVKRLNVLNGLCPYFPKSHNMPGHDT